MSTAVIAFMVSSLPVVLFRAARHAGRSMFLSLLSSAALFIVLAWLGHLMIGDGPLPYMQWITGMALGGLGAQLVSNAAFGDRTRHLTP